MSANHPQSANNAPRSSECHRRREGSGERKRVESKSNIRRRVGLRFGGCCGDGDSCIEMSVLTLVLGIVVCVVVCLAVGESIFECILEASSVMLLWSLVPQVFVVSSSNVDYH